MSALRTRLVAGGVAALLLATTVTAASATPTSAAGPALAKGATVRAWQVRHPGPRVAKLVWRDCGDGLQCATARVPPDYDRPRGRKITLSLIRRLATDPRQRIGSLFLNPGGPGGSAMENVRNARSWGVLGERFDILGMDTRGVNESTPVRCLHTNEENQRFQHLVQDAPANKAHYRRQKAAARDFARRCLKRNGEFADAPSEAIRTVIESREESAPGGDEPLPWLSRLAGGVPTRAPPPP